MKRREQILQRERKQLVLSSWKGKRTSGQSGEGFEFSKLALIKLISKIRGWKIFEKRRL